MQKIMLFRYAVLVLDLEGEINTATRRKKRVNIFCSARRIYKHIYILSNLTDLYISVRVVIKIVQILLLHFTYITPHSLPFTWKKKYFSCWNCQWIQLSINSTGFATHVSLTLISRTGRIICFSFCCCVLMMYWRVN